MRDMILAVEGECRALLRRLGAQGQWPGLRGWMAAQAILPQAGVRGRDLVALWIEETIAGDEMGSDKLQLIALAADGWLPAMERSGGYSFRLTTVPPDLDGAGEARVRLLEVAGFLDGLLNRGGDPPDDARFREEVARLEAIEELLDGLGVAGGAASRAAGLVIDNLARAIEEGIVRLAAICGAISASRPNPPRPLPDA